MRRDKGQAEGKLLAGVKVSHTLDGLWSISTCSVCISAHWFLCYLPNNLHRLIAMCSQLSLRFSS